MALDPSGHLIEVTQDKMEASFKLLNAPTSPLDKSEIVEALAAKGIRHGLIISTIESIAAEGKINVTHLVAKGNLATPGIDEKVEFNFPTSTEIVVEESESGTVDFRNIQNFFNVRAGDALAAKSARVPAVPGMTVYGDELNAKDGKEISFKLGKGVALSEDNSEVFAEIDGHACLVNDRITVMNTVEIPAHVDYSVGNISFVGNVKIRGGVMPDFIVEAEQDIEITGNVEKAKIACGGHLTIQGIVFGQDDCIIEVKKDAQIGAIDQAVINVQGSLMVNSYIRHCKVHAGDKVIVSGQKGNIVGGEIHALTGIEAPFIGNSMATLTKLTVGSNPFVSQQASAAKREIDELETKLEQVNNALSTLRDRISIAGGNDPKSEAMVAKLKVARSQIETNMVGLRKRLKKAAEASSDFKSAKIKVSDVVYPGVVVNFRDKLQYKTMDETQHVTFFEENAEIRTGPL